MRRHRRAQTALTALLVLGVALAGCTSNPASTSAGATAGTSPPSSPSGAPPSEGVPDYQLLPDAGTELALAAGRYALTPVGPSSGPLAVVDVPPGFVGSGPFLFPADARTSAADECCIVGYWTVARVYRDPCKATVAKDPGPSVQDLADALSAQRTTSTKPTPVTLGGSDGVYMELTAPAGLGTLSTCTDGGLAFWESDPGTRLFGASHYDPSKGLPVERVWILDVDGQRVVLSVGVESGIGEQQAQPLVDIVESTQFITE